MRVHPHENTSTAPTLQTPLHHCTILLTPQHEDIQNAFPTARKRKPHRIADRGKQTQTERIRDIGVRRKVRPCISEGSARKEFERPG